MSIVHERIQGIEMVRITGNLSFERVTLARNMMKPLVLDRQNKILISLEGVPVIDSSGIGLLIGLQTTAQKNQVSFALCGLSSFIFDSFQLIGLDKIFTIYPTEKEALLKLSKQ